MSPKEYLAVSPFSCSPMRIFRSLLWRLFTSWKVATTPWSCPPTSMGMLLLYTVVPLMRLRVSSWAWPVWRAVHRLEPGISSRMFRPRAVSPGRWRMRWATGLMRATRPAWSMAMMPSWVN